MSFNSSSTTNAFYLRCRSTTSNNAIFTTYTVANVLFFFPLYILVLYMGFHRRRHQSMSHSDFFTYNMMLLEISSTLGSIFYTLSNITGIEVLLMLGLFFFCFIFPGQTMFHALTCVDRYLAVVHPITYMKLRETSGVRIRNVMTAFVWLLCFVYIGIIILYFPVFPNTALLSLLGVCVVIVLFCCLSALHVLTRPGPGQVGGNKERVDQSKQRAFHMIAAITVALLVRSVGLLVCFGLEYMPQTDRDMENLCALLTSAIWMTAPSSLVLPLLFLHRAEKLTCFQRIALRSQGNRVN